ncbi:MAG TPA: NAD(P)H-dependent glycerol-3-phosphate dehydrogenase, partial [bacterium]|nr:NAD(P)H-dependent glycerol-3-phosphate dehydrogenase [bacterium]
AIILAIPSHHVTEVVDRHRPFLADRRLPICSSVKGFLDDRLTRVSKALAATLPGNPVAVLSGPNLAKEVMRGDPTVTVVASDDDAAFEVFRELLARPTFRIYGSRDVAGVEVGGAVKNILALAAGITTGLGFGMNTQAALLSRGLAEMVVLGTDLGAQKETLMGIAGLGDAVCTCLSPLSRNVQVGRMLGEGTDLQHALQAASGVAEGVETACHVACYAEAHGLEMPITGGIAWIVEGRRSPGETLGLLMDRAWKMEVP